jgi:hypothetical protein
MNSIGDLQRAATAAAGGGALAPRPPRRDALGLSTTHIRPQKSDLWQVNAYNGGSLIEVLSPGLPGQKGGGKRGIIKRFSEASRRRLLRALSRTQRDKLPVFVTLTYPDGFPGDPRRWKEDLKAWLKRVVRQFPDCAGFWKLELKTRLSGSNEGETAPHFHLLLWGLAETWEDPEGWRKHWEYFVQRQGYATPTLCFWKREVSHDGRWSSSVEHVISEEKKALPVEVFVSERQNRRGQSVRVVEHWLRDGGAEFRKWLERTSSKGEVYKIQLREWVSLTWAAVVKSGDPRHVRAGTRVEQIRSREGVMFYASKYVGKLDTEAVGNAGRFWGLHNVRAMPWAEVVKIPMDRKQAVRVMRVARRYIWSTQRKREHPRKIHWRANCGMTFFCDSSWWLQRLPSLAGG